MHTAVRAGMTPVGVLWGFRDAAELRGMGADGTQIVVNGVTVNSPSLGAADVGKIPMNNIERIEIVTMDHFTQVEDWCTIFAPDLVTKITPVELENAVRDLALLEYRDVLGQIESLFQGYVMLTNGGSLIIQETAALTAIDVNRGSDKRSRLAVNINAAKEIARQMRLRNIQLLI